MKKHTIVIIIVVFVPGGACLSLVVSLGGSLQHPAADRHDPGLVCLAVAAPTFLPETIIENILEIT